MQSSDTNRVWGWKTVIVTQGSMFCLLLTAAHKYIFMMSGQPITTDEYCLYSHNMSCTYGMWNLVVIYLIQDWESVHTV